MAVEFKFKHPVRLSALVAAGIMLVTASMHIAASESSPNSIGSRDWRTDQWRNDDRPFVAVMKELDQTAARRALNTGQIEGFWADYRIDEHNPLKAFRWQYACYLADHQFPPVYVKTGGSALAFNTAVDPDTYSYSRLHFLLSDPDALHNTEIVAIGKRLLARNPDDYHVESALVFDLMPWLSPDRKSEALYYARDLVARRPKDAGARRIMGIDVYYSCWSQTNDKYDADRAIAWCQSYLNMALPGDPNKQYALQYIGIVRSAMAKKLGRQDYVGDPIIDPLLK